MKPQKNPFSLSERMKTYENVTRNYLTRRTPVIIRVDGKSFSQWTRNLSVRPFSEDFSNIMTDVMFEVANSLQGCCLAYRQSDEISFFLRDYDTVNTDAYFGNNIQKITTVCASMVTALFNQKVLELYNSRPASFVNGKPRVAFFDARAFNLPKEEVANYFIYRQNDCVRNSVNMLASALFSHKEIQGLKVNELKEKIKTEKVDFDWDTSLDNQFKYGVYVCTNDEYPTVLDYMFKDDKAVIDKEVYIKE